MSRDGNECFLRDDRINSYIAAERGNVVNVAGEQRDLECAAVG